MSQSSSGPPLTPSPEPEERSTTDGIIHHTTDMCQEAVQGALERSYADVDLEGYDQSLVDAAAAIDQALGRYDLATPGPERDKILAELSRRVEALADTPAPDPLEDGWPEDLDVHPRVDAERLLADTLEALDRADATALRTYWAGASDVARARLAAAVQRVAEGPIARRVAALGFPTDAARQRGIEVEDLPARIAAEMLAVTSMASVVSTERVEHRDWVSQLATLLEETAHELERGPAWGPGLTPEEQAMSRIAAQLYREILVSVVHDAVSAEERFVEELEDGREWNADQVASSAVRAVLNVLAVRGVPVTTDMVLAGMTPGMLTSSIVDALREAALRRAWPDLERGARRQAAKAAKAERRKKSEDARKARKAARRRRRRS